MAKTTAAGAVADRATDALWLAALPSPPIAAAQDRRPAAAPVAPAEGVLSGLPGPVTDMTVSRDGRWLVAAHFGDDAISVVDTADLTVHATLAGVAEPYALAVADRIYVTSARIGEDAIVAVDIAGAVALAAKDITATVRGLAVSPDGETLYAARCGETVADIAAIDVASGRLTSIPVTDTPDATVDAVRINTEGTRLFVTLTTVSGAALAVVDIGAGRVVRTVETGGSIGDIAVHRDGRRVFATGWDDEHGGLLTVIDTAAGRVLDTIAVGGLATQVVLTATRACVLHGDEVAVVDVATSQIIERIGIGRPLACLAVNPDATLLYIADFGGTVITRAAAGDSGLRAAS